MLSTTVIVLTIFSMQFLATSSLEACRELNPSYRGLCLCDNGLLCLSDNYCVVDDDCKRLSSTGLTFVCSSYQCMIGRTQLPFIPEANYNDFELYRPPNIVINHTYEFDPDRYKVKDNTRPRTVVGLFALAACITGILLARASKLNAERSQATVAHQGAELRRTL
ncbi:hypothetical protein HDE_10822 [Halotydeus destructor]|nr:hypothetical protein HDE_10822 [Halotydeus destructor]